MTEQKDKVKCNRVYTEDLADPLGALELVFPSEISQTEANGFTSVPFPTLTSQWRDSSFWHKAILGEGLKLRGRQHSQALEKLLVCWSSLGSVWLSTQYSEFTIFSTSVRTYYLIIFYLTFEKTFKVNSFKTYL